MVVTKDAIYFALPDENVARDYIPLHEVVNISVKHEATAPETDLQPQSEKSKLKSTNSITAYRFFFGFQIETVQQGYNSGRTYHIQSSDKDQCNQIVGLLQQLFRKAVSAAKKATQFQVAQDRVRAVYESRIFQLATAALIISNFGLNVYAAEFAHKSREAASSASSGDFRGVNLADLIFVVLFAAELAVNLFAHWLRPFLGNFWSIFDLLIVGVSLVGLGDFGLPLQLLLLLRCLRVLRIFGKFKAVTAILAAVYRSAVPMASTFLIVFVVASIYAIVGVTFFADEAPDHFDTFRRAFVSMFRITTGSVDWFFSAFPTIEEDGTLPWRANVFIITYVIVINWFFFQVSIAILLDKFRDSSKEQRLQKINEAIELSRRSKQLTNPLDPLLLRLSKDFSDDADLSKRLQQLFKVLDADNLTYLDSERFRIALRKLMFKNPGQDFNPRINLSDSDFIGMTQHMDLINGELRDFDFEKLMREQLVHYTQARLSSMSEFWVNEERDFTTLGTLKHVLGVLLGLRTDFRSLLCTDIAKLPSLHSLGGAQSKKGSFRSASPVAVFSSPSNATSPRRRASLVNATPRARRASVAGTGSAALVGGIGLLLKRRGSSLTQRLRLKAESAVQTPQSVTRGNGRNDFQDSLSPGNLIPTKGARRKSVVGVSDEPHAPVILASRRASMPNLEGAPRSVSGVDAVSASPDAESSGPRVAAKEASRKRRGSTTGGSLAAPNAEAAVSGVLVGLVARAPSEPVKGRRKSVVGATTNIVKEKSSMPEEAAGLRSPAAYSPATPTAGYWSPDSGAGADSAASVSGSGKDSRPKQSWRNPHRRSANLSPAAAGQDGCKPTGPKADLFEHEVVFVAGVKTAERIVAPDAVVEGGANLHPASLVGAASPPEGSDSRFADSRVRGVSRANRARTPSQPSMPQWQSIRERRSAALGTTTSSVVGLNIHSELVIAAPTS